MYKGHQNVNLKRSHINSLFVEPKSKRFKYPGTEPITVKTGNWRTSMPTKYKRRRRRRRRGVIRKRIPRAITSKQKVISCKASKYLNNTCTTGNLSMHKVNGMNVADPFVGSASVQPLGYDQWTALYDKAYVLGCKVKLTVHNGSANSVVYGITAMKQDQGSTALSDYEYYREVSGTKSRLLSPDVDHGYISQQRSTKKHLAIKNLIDEDYEIDLSSESGPSNPYYFHCWCQPADKATTVTDIEFIIDVEYIILLRDAIVPSRSAHT